MEHFLIIVNDLQPLTIITKRFILDVADTMSLKRSEVLKRSFYLKNNTDMQKKGTPEFDVLSKVRLMVDSLLER